MLCNSSKRSIENTIQTLLLIFFALGYGILLKAQSRVHFADSIRVLKERETLFEGNDRLITLNNSHIATIYDKWAKMEADKGFYQYATDLYGEALAIEPMSANSNFLLHINQCELFLRRGMYASAKNILDMLAPSTAWQDFVYHSHLASYFLYMNKTEAAKEVLTYLLQHAASKTERSNVALNLSYLYYQESDYHAAYNLLINEVETEENNQRKYIVLSHLAIVESELGLFLEAFRDIDMCLAGQREILGMSHQDYIISLRKKAEILQRAGKKDKAADSYIQYIQAEKKEAIRNFPYFKEQQRLDYWKNKKELISEVFTLDYNKNDYIEFLYNVALFRRQVALLGKNDSLTMSHKLSYSQKKVAKNLGKKDIAIEFVKYEKDKENRYAALILAGSDKKHVKFIPLWSEDSIKAYNVGGNRLDSALCSKIRADKDCVYKNESLSSYVWDKLLPFIPEGSTVYFAPDGILHLLAIEYLPTVNNGKYDFHRLTTTALLAEKKKKSSKLKTKSLVVGGMDYDFIPPIDENVTLSSNKDAYNYLLQTSNLSHYSYLPGTEVECDSIIYNLTSFDRLKDIDEGALKNCMGDYTNIHLATHGYSWHIDVPSVPYAFRDSITEDKSLLASGIAISGANVLHRRPLRDDGLLSARELCEMNLTGVELVVASACQSAQGRVSDEGPTGLVRGLKKAGVKTIIASLWPVNDKATMLLMQFFYDEWREGKGKDGKGCSKTRALHLAQERLRNIEGTPTRIRTYNSSTKTGDYKTITSSYDSPYYWAPFIIIDDI